MGTFPHNFIKQIIMIMLKRLFRLGDLPGEPGRNRLFKRNHSRFDIIQKYFKYNDKTLKIPRNWRLNLEC